MKTKFSLFACFQYYFFFLIKNSGPIQNDFYNPVTGHNSHLEKKAWFWKKNILLAWELKLKSLANDKIQ
jgi:hypothetical protein